MYIDDLKEILEDITKEKKIHMIYGCHNIYIKRDLNNKLNIGMGENDEEIIIKF